MIPNFFQHVSDVFEPTLEEWLEENNLVPCDHSLVIFESKTRKLALGGNGEFNDFFPLSTQQSAVISSGNVTLEDTTIDTMNETYHINSKLSFLPIGENYFLVSTRKAPFVYSLYIRK